MNFANQFDQHFLRNLCLFAVSFVTKLERRNDSTQQDSLNKDGNAAYVFGYLIVIGQQDASCC